MKAAMLYLIIIFTAGCTDTTKVPANILAQNKMELVLWDMLLAERFSVLYQLKDSATKNVQLQKFELYDQVFAIHKISKDDFLKSYKYYLGRPDISKVMFDSISVRAERQKVNNYKRAPVK